MFERASQGNCKIKKSNKNVLISYIYIYIIITGGLAVNVDRSRQLNDQEYPLYSDLNELNFGGEDRPICCIFAEGILNICSPYTK